MSKTIGETPPQPTSTMKSLLGRLFWPVILGTILGDFLSLCHLLPTHSQHLYRPYMLSVAQFKVFRNKN
ncbi:uncharacterized protein LOC119610805 [Lucilia sericata]|uniref:uncharacterized protein LOC119610805 n=1 Tax=Lucilia sericata TaxID=13632 RepID=UPI0018A7FC05|nr:uncharacterized protein LOC119610805 [Lucilia sericata]